MLCSCVITELIGTFSNGWIKNATVKGGKWQGVGGCGVKKKRINYIGLNKLILETFFHYLF